MPTSESESTKNPVPADESTEDKSSGSPAIRQLSAKQTRFFSIFFLLSSFLLGLVLWPFWQWLLLAFLLAGIFRPVYKKLNTWVSPWMASLLTCGLIVLLVFVPLFFSISSLSQEVVNLLQHSKDTDILMELQQFLQENSLILKVREILDGYGIHFNFDPPQVIKMLSGLSKTAGLFVYNQVSGWAADIMKFALQFCILIVVAYFILIDMDNLIDFILRLSPLPDEHNRLLVNKFTRIAGVILIGNGMYCIVQGTLGGVLFSLLDLNAPVLWGFVMGTLAFIPILGIGMVLLPTAVILLFAGAIGKAIAVAVFYLLLHYTVELLLKPKFVGSHLKMHPLLVLLAIFGGLSLFGILGIVYGPLILSLFLTLTDMYIKEYRRDDVSVVPPA
jgi:predicted PurR-regulated permease PerM